MSTETVSGNAILAHVPVDRFTIVNGPSAKKCHDLFGDLCDRVTDEGPQHINVTFTLVTLASTTRFRRTLRITHLRWEVKSELLSFTGVFSGISVRGLYNTAKRTGSFTASS